MSSLDILVVGATGFTGKLVTKYLASHPDRERFTLGIGARSKAKGETLLASLGVSQDDVTLVSLDVTNETQVNEAVARAKVVVNTAGPFYRLGTPVIKACAQQGKHYVDISGEPAWTLSILDEIDKIASGTHAIMIPSSGLDCIPSDLLAFLSVRALQEHCESKQVSWPGASTSYSGFDMVFTPSGGTLSSMKVAYSEVPSDVLRAATAAYSLSPVKGKDVNPAPLPLRRVANLPHHWGSYFIMAATNRLIVQRTWGLLEQQTAGASKAFVPYGADFKYDEVALAPSALSAFFGGLSSLSSFYLFSTLPPVRWLVTKLTPPGTGPSESALKSGHLNATNVTHLAGDERTFARTTIRAKGDPGYFLTSVMAAESALALLLHPREELGPLAARGGMLTPVTALGAVLPDRLRRTGIFEIASEIVRDEDQKTR
ncbi:hypothetical protein AURDEDRAFT_92562 [Auricularia subglabra TFB-10046 SS5]|nr:hypothetical protein AURDEDRAFT_92562 [Auricularia subglabra TFB-10046 SS5]